MRNFAIVLFSFMLIAGCDCKKPPAPVVEDLLVQIMTDGEWSITNFTVNSTTFTADYAGWRFKFYENKTMDAKYNGTLTYTGTWDGSASNMTFTASFPSATTPVDRINGTWTVSATGSRVVDATMTSGGNVKVMRLYRE